MLDFDVERDVDVAVGRYWGSTSPGAMIVTGVQGRDRRGCEYFAVYRGKVWVLEET